MEPIRRRQLIDATMKSIDEVGFSKTTVNSISRHAGVSPGIIAHYFGGKGALLQATMLHMLNSIKHEFQVAIDAFPEKSHYDRLIAIIKVNFSAHQISPIAAKTWLAFWTHALHEESLLRLQKISESRLISNLTYELRYLVGLRKARTCAKALAALIDGLWLRGALSAKGIQAEESIHLCTTLLSWMIEEYKGNDHPN